MLADGDQDGEVADEEFLDHMYFNVFGRQPDEEGYDWWASQLQEQIFTQETAFASMVQSDEFVLTTAGNALDYIFG